MSDLHSIKPGSRLYILKCGTGFSSLGFDVAERWRIGVLTWAGLPAETMRLGTKRHYAAYRAAMDAGRKHADATRTKCPVELTPALIGLEGKRVEVAYKAEDGHAVRERFNVGRSTGWLPIHLAIKTRRSMGGCAAYVPAGATVRVIS